MKVKMYLDISIIPVVFLVLALNTTIFVQTSIIKGKLLDVEGNPSKFGLIGITGDNPEYGHDFVKCDDKGNYTIKLSTPGWNVLLYSIPSHKSLRIPVQNNKEKKLTIDVTLSPYKYKDNFDNLRISGPFNNYKYQTAERMIEKEDGTYIFEVESDSQRIKYQLCGIEKEDRTINGTESIDFETDKSGDYFSIIRVDSGTATIVFDPTRLLKKDVDYKVDIKGSNYDKKMFNYYQLYVKLKSDFAQKFNSYINTHRNIQGFEYNSSNDFTKLLKKIDYEKNQDLKTFLKLIYFSFTRYKSKGYNFAQATSFFESIKFDNPKWDMIPEAIVAYISLFPSNEWDDLQDRFLKESKSVFIKSNILQSKLMNAKSMNNVVELIKLHALISSEYKDNKDLQDLLKQYPIENN